MPREEKDIADMMIAMLHDKRFWEFLGNMMTLTFYTLLVFPAAIIVELLYVGRGPRCYHPAVLIATNSILLILAWMFDNLAGDIVFMVWGLYFGKTMTEAVWAFRRWRAGSREHSAHFGVCLLSPLGIYHPYVALILPAGVGLGLLAIKGGLIIGLLMIFGSIGAYYLIARGQVIEAVQRGRENDMVIEAEWREVASDEHDRGANRHQRVRIR